MFMNLIEFCSTSNKIAVTYAFLDDDRLARASEGGGERERGGKKKVSVQMLGDG